MGLLHVRSKLRVRVTPHGHNEAVILGGSGAITQALSDAASLKRPQYGAYGQRRGDLLIEQTRRLALPPRGCE